MSVNRQNVEAAKAMINVRLGLKYAYGSMFSPTNLQQSTDCSGLWNDILGMAVGRMQWGREAEGATTESYRYIPVGGVGPFGTIRVASPRDIPANAAAKLAFHHEGNGGAASHMWGEIDGVRYESGGSKGVCTAPQAWPIDHPYANAWAYLPGPIVEDGTTPATMPVQDITWGIDISNHQGVMDLDRVKAEGFSFVWAKVSEGADYRDPFWPRTRDDAKRLGLILAGYHYVRTGDPAAQARTFVDQLGDKSIPAMLDFEAGSGGMEQFWAVKDAIEKLGVAVRLSYIPDWYWEQIGKPDLSKVPGLIRSEYVSGTGYASVLYPGNSSSLWGAYGGRSPDILQFTDKAIVAGKAVDANAFRGTPEQLRALLAGQPMTGEDDMFTEDDRNLLRQISDIRRPSLSPLRRPGEGNVNTCAGFAWAADGLTHPQFVDMASRYGHIDSITILLTVAADRDPDRVADAQLAANILTDAKAYNPSRFAAALAQIQATNPGVLTAYLAAQKG